MEQRTSARLPRARLVRIAVLAATLTAGDLARADEPMASFEWDAPAECPSRDSVRDAVRAISRAGNAHAGSHVRAVVTAGSPWVARIRIEHGGELGDRRLEASSCEALGHAVALVVALAIDRAETAPPDVAPSAPPAVAPATPATTATAPSRSEAGAPSAVRSDIPRRFAAHAGLTVRSGLLPSSRPGIEAGAAFTFDALELSARGALFARSSTAAQAADADTKDSAAGSFLLVTMEARAAWVIRATSSIHVAPFGGVGLAYLQGEGRGADVDQRASDWLPMPFAGVEGRARVGHGIEPYIGLDGGLPLGRSSFHFRGMSEAVFQPALVSLRASAGGRFYFF